MKRDAPPSSAPGPAGGPARSWPSPIFLVLADSRLFGSFPKAVKRVEEGAREALGIEPISVGVSGPEHLHRLRETVVEARRRGASLLIVVDEGSKLLSEVVKAADLTLEAASLIRARPAEEGRVEFRLLSSPGKAGEVPSAPPPQGPFKCPTCGLVAPDELPRCPRCGTYSGSPPAALGASVLSGPEDLAARHPSLGEVGVSADLERRLRAAFFGRATAFKIHLLGALAEESVKPAELKCLPSLRKVNPLPHQVEAARRALIEAGGRALLCDPTGAGKTVEVGLVLAELRARREGSEVLIFAPRGLLPLWQEELRSKFGLEFRIAEGLEGMRRGRRLFPLEALPDLPQGAFSHRQDAVIVDEAHRLGGRRSPAWRTIFGLRTKRLFLLTASPFRRGVGGLFDLLALLQPGLVGAPSEFAARFALDDETLRVEALPELRELLSQVAVYTGEEAPLPARKARAVFVKIGKGELDSLLRAEGEVLRSLEAGALSADGATRALSSLPSPGSPLSPSKVRALLDILRKARRPAVVYSADKGALPEVAAELSKAGLDASFGAGRRRREAQILLVSDEEAARSPSPQAATIVNLDLPPDPVLLARRVERHLKPGGQREVEVLFICVKGTFEERLFKAAIEGAGLLDLPAGGVEAALYEAFGEEALGKFIGLLLRGDAEALGRELLLAKEHLRQAESRSAEILRQVFGEGLT